MNAGYIEEEEYEQQIRELLGRETERVEEYREVDRVDERVGEVLKVFNNLKIEDIQVSLVYKLKNDKEIKKE